MAVVVVRYETTATARRASLFSVRAFFNDTITVAIWTGFHGRLMRMLPHPSWARGHGRPLYPRNRTCAVQLRMSAMGQKRTHAVQQKWSLFDHFIGPGE
jgi:hypothetical protein